VRPCSRIDARTRALAALALVALLLAACAPSVLGSRSNPHRLDRDGPLALRVGDTAYVRVDVPRSVFALTRTELGPRLAPWGDNLSRATVTPLFDVRDLVGPGDWEVGTHERRRVPERSSQREADLEVVLSVTCPPARAPGGSACAWTSSTSADAATVSRSWCRSPRYSLSAP
jgi:hypothetical protein